MNPIKRLKELSAKVAAAKAAERKEIEKEIARIETIIASNPALVLVEK